MGEKALQGLAPEEDCAYLFIGQAGIGTAMIVNHRLVRGRDDASGEIDGIPLVGNDVMQKHLLGKNLVARAQAVSPGVRDVEDILSAYRLDVRWARPVSYTHLDVYKRQGYPGAAPRVGRNGWAAAFPRPPGGTVDTSARCPRASCP